MEPQCELALARGDPHPCGKYEAGLDGKCVTCRHMKACHDLVTKDPPWRASP